MNIEQKPGVPKYPSGYPHTIKEVSNTTGMSNATVIGQINRDIRLGPASFTDPQGHIWLSDTGYDLAVEGVLNRKEGKSANHSDGNTKINSRLGHARQAGETLMHDASKKEITLPNGKTIKTKRGRQVTATIVIKEILSAQQNNTPYTEQQIINRRETFYSNSRWIERVEFWTNNMLKPYGYEFTPYEIEDDEGKKTRAFKVTEIKEEKSTSSPELKSPKDEDHS